MVTMAENQTINLNIIHYLLGVKEKMGICQNWFSRWGFHHTDCPQKLFLCSFFI